MGDNEYYNRWYGMLECAIIPLNHVEAMQDLMQELRQRCESCRFFQGTKPDRIWIFQIKDVEYATEDGPAMLAIAQYGKCQAVLEPKYLTEKQWYIVHHFVERIIDRPESYVVFSKELHRRLLSAGCRSKSVYFYE